MSKRSLLLRCLLALALLCNGMASAVASVHAHAPAEAMPATAPCHEGGADFAPMPDAAEADAMASCCVDGLCDCACAFVAIALPAPAVAPGLSMPDARATPVHVAGHRGPALPHPIRPPIG